MSRIEKMKLLTRKGQIEFIRHYQGGSHYEELANLTDHEIVNKFIPLVEAYSNDNIVLQKAMDNLDCQSCGEGHHPMGRCPS